MLLVVEVVKGKLIHPLGQLVDVCECIQGL
jgi:hypothetical protein